MKTFKTKIILIAVFCFVTFQNNSTAQLSACFIPAAVSPLGNLSCSANNAPNETECDDLATAAIYMSNEISVMVRDNSASNGEQFGWDDHYGNSGTNVLIYPDAQNLDIALVDDANHSVCYAIIVYYSPGAGGVFYEVWQWSNGTSSFGSGAVANGTLESVQPSAVHIDASYYGDFAITWDNVSNKHIKVEAGKMISTTVTFSTNIVDVSSVSYTNTSGAYPDVAIHNSSSQGACGFSINQIYLTWLSANTPNTVYESDFLTTSTYTGSWSTSVPWSASAQTNYNFKSPRIAAASDYNQGSSGWDCLDDWVIVLGEEILTPISEIKAYIKQGGSVISPQVYTDATISPLCAIDNGYNNYFPKVSYDQVNGNVIIVWISTYSGDPSTFIPNGPVAVVLDPTLSNYPLASLCTNFMVVPDNNLTCGVNEEPVAVSGARGKDMFYCWYDNAPSTPIYLSYKSVNSFSALRVANFQLNLQDDLKFFVYPNPFSDGVYIKVDGLNSKTEDNTVIVNITDLAGRTIFRSEDLFKNIQEETNKISSKLSKGSYSLEIKNPNGMTVYRNQIIKM